MSVDAGSTFEWVLREKTNVMMAQDITDRNKQVDMNGTIVCKQQRPLLLIQWIIKTFVDGSDKTRAIIDAYSGTATTSLAAATCGFNSFAFDAEKTMVQVAEERLKRHQTEVINNDTESTPKMMFEYLDNFITRFAESHGVQEDDDEGSVTNEAYGVDGVNDSAAQFSGSPEAAASNQNSRNRQQLAQAAQAVADHLDIQQLTQDMEEES